MPKGSFIWIVVPLAFFLVLPSCAGTDGQRITETPDNFERVNRSIDRLTDSYEKENASSFMGGVGRDYDFDYIDLENQVRDEFDRFDAFDLTIIVDRVSVDSSGSVVFADTHWTKRRVSGRTGTEGKQTGRTTFIFRITGNGDLILKGMKGDRVFGIN